MSMFGLLRDETEEVLNALLDLAAKLVYAVSLMVLNFTVIDQVRCEYHLASSWIGKFVPLWLERGVDMSLFGCSWVSA